MRYGCSVKNSTRTGCISAVGSALSRSVTSDDSGGNETWRSQVSSGELGETDEFVGAAVSLTSDVWRYISATTLPVGGGFVDRYSQSLGALFGVPLFKSYDTVRALWRC